MFFGSFEHQVDAKGRMRLPAPFRKLFDGDDVVACKGTDSCIYIYRMSDFEKDLSTLRQVSMVGEDKKALKAYRVLSSSVTILQQDAQNRFSIGKPLKDFASIKRDVIFVGNMNRIELWAKEVWDAYVEGDADGTPTSYDELLEVLAPISGGDNNDND